MNNEENYEKLYHQLEVLKHNHPKETLLVDFCQRCLTDDRLKYLPNEITLRNRTIVFDYEEENGDHLSITFNGDSISFETKAISYYAFIKKSKISSSAHISWNDMKDFINNWREESA